ncbi:alpha/beta hydrolase family protein [Kibdelosporangium philippinense]|uniref:Alpha/beta hydrolase family protein n=1 Tax=Kibdelosporangium philippinense TaxID=211113 RepID=A0ABS8ZUF9_9PSEU|nr:alpha/beta hydrolase [Kibdelosporangium philippinense]MCE7011346.1 alpha/beta hydrolase family protein [Kibdelosporangium philippinense]
MPSYGDIRKWQSGPLDTSVGDLNRCCDELIGLSDELAATGTPHGWTGQSADQARAKREELNNRMERLVAGVAAVRRGMGEAADAVEALGHAVKETEDIAQHHHFVIRDDGSIVDNAPETAHDPAHIDEYFRERQRVQTELADRVEQAIRRGTDIDNDLAAILTRAEKGEVDDQGATSLQAAAAAGGKQGGLSTLEPPKDGTPWDNAGWWDSLSDAERKQIIQQHPDWIGNLDGVPGSARDEANRNRLDDERAKLEARKRELEADLDDNWFGGTFTNADAELEHVNAKLDSLNKIEETLAKGDRQLLLLNMTNERAEAAVANGNIDTADHVAVFTPGLTSTVNGSLGGYDKQMEELRLRSEQELKRYGDGGSVATVTWIGYQAPQLSFGGVVFDDNTVLDDHSAKEGAKKLAPFLNGIDASRATDPHMTALGHSYGSTTTGLALQQNTGVDNAVFYGSPGLGTDDINKINVPTGNAFYIEAKNDAVGDFGYFGRDPSHMDGMNHISAKETTLPDGRHLSESTGHSAYMVDKSTSQYNLGVVVGGMQDRVVRDDGRGVGDIFTWPFPGTK